MRWLAIAMLLSTATAYADDTLGREMCTSTTRYRGATRDLDVKDADIRDVFRLLADTGKINLVVSDDVTGRVTMRLRNVPWDQILCTVAAVHKLRVTIDRSIVMVTRKRTR
jgi:type IV pilus assembly protein PilQ